MQQGRLVGALGGHGGAVGVGVERQVEAVRRGGGEARVRAVAPLHGGARARPVVVRAQHAALLVGQVRHVPHADLVAVVDRRERGPGELEDEGGGQLLGGARAAVEAGEVVVGGGQRDVAAVAHSAGGASPGVQEGAGRALAARVEEAVQGVPGVVDRARAVAPQRAQGQPVRGAAELQEEVRVEARRDGHLRVAPLRQQHRARMRAVQPVPQLRPDRAGPCPVGVVLDERGGHVDAEARHAQAQPVVHDLAQRRPVGARPLGVHGLPPGFGRVLARVAEVEGRLAVEEVRQVRARAAAR